MTKSTAKKFIELLEQYQAAHSNFAVAQIKFNIAAQSFFDSMGELVMGSDDAN